MRLGILVAVLVLLVGAVPGMAAGHRPAAAGSPVTPAVVDDALAPGGSLQVAKTVDTPVVPPRPDVVLLVDGTGSMGPTIDDIRRDLSAVTDQVRQEQPDARFAVATFGDQQVDGDRVFTVLQGLTSDMTAVQAGVDALTADRGFGSPGPSEDWINALWQIADGADGQITFRQEASPVVVLVGDASSHDPSEGHTLGDATGALQNAGVRVLGVDVSTDLGDGLNGNGDNGNGPGQNGEPTHEPSEASTVVNATGGRLMENIEPSEVARTIGDGLADLPTTVTYQTVGCDPALQVSLDPASRTVISGDPARFQETVHAVGDAPQGTELTCTVQFLLDGKVPGGNAPDAVTVDPLSRRTRSGPDRIGSASTAPTSTGRTTVGIGGGVGAVAGSDGGGYTAAGAGVVVGVAGGDGSCGWGVVAGLAGGLIGGPGGGLVAGAAGGLIGGAGDCGGGRTGGGSGDGGVGGGTGSSSGAVGGVVGGVSTGAGGGDSQGGTVGSTGTPGGPGNPGGPGSPGGLAVRVVRVVPAHRVVRVDPGDLATLADPGHLVDPAVLVDPGVLRVVAFPPRPTTTRKSSVSPSVTSPPPS